MSTPFNPPLSADYKIAQQEASHGMHHTFYFLANIKRLLVGIGLDFNYKGSDPLLTGAHWGEFTDPRTGIKYEVRITPQNQRKDDYSDQG